MQCYGQLSKCWLRPRGLSAFGVWKVLDWEYRWKDLIYGIDGLWVIRGRCSTARDFGVRMGCIVSKIQSARYMSDMELKYANAVAAMSGF